MIHLLSQNNGCSWEKLVEVRVTFGQELMWTSPRTCHCWEFTINSFKGSDIIEVGAVSSFNHLFQDLIVTCLYKAPASRLSCVRSMTARKALPTITDKHWVMASTYRENRGVLITCTTIFMLPSIFPTASVSLQVQVLTSRAQWLLLCLGAPSPAH